MRKYSTGAFFFSWLARQMKKFIRIKVQFPVQSQDFSEFSCLVHTYNSISKHPLGRGSQMPSSHCMLTCMKVQPPDSYWLTVIQKRPITNRKHPHWVEQLAECDTRVRSAPRPRGRWGICCWTVGQKKAIHYFSQLKDGESYQLLR